MVRLDRLSLGFAVVVAAGLSLGFAVVVARLCLRLSRVMHRSLRLCLMAMMMRPLSKSKRSPQGAGKPGKGLRSAKKTTVCHIAIYTDKEGGNSPRITGLINSANCEISASHVAQAAFLS